METDEWQGGHCARPDLIRLLVDKLPKTCIVDANAAGPHTFQSTLERLGLGNPLTLDDH
jgi:cyanide hydratase